MKPYEEVCFPFGIIRWTREGDLYVCRLLEHQMNEIKEIHEQPWVKTYSGGKPNYTEPCERCGEVNPAEIHTCTPKQPEPEPVAKPEGCSVCGIKGIHACPGYRWRQGDTPPTATYTTPPQREWQGLTEKETIDLALSAFALPEVSSETREKIHRDLVIAMNDQDSRLMLFAANIEAKLKEKNND